ncbi:hypothetical protein HELRODRAFT_156242 [Helobdella robusta]|uniref:Dynein light chain n=1 Tax=Helobdella robusta TaxID=6412 RepID=T1ELT3_HELRO|nr:hypothetical protein HELRODRAFT_156242 [Helobdella robusta]ESO11644.1 hypothetical protein HELRODRAFT_156242 [Helobdella robusta]
MADENVDKKEEGKKHTYPLIQYSDMHEEMKIEAMELCVTACEKFSNNNEQAAKMIKDLMDKKFGMPWNVCVGEGFGFEVTFHKRNILFMFFGGNIGILVWKIS